MLKNYICQVDVWGGDKIVKEPIMAENPKKAAEKARVAVQKKFGCPFGMVKVVTVELAK